MANKHLPKFTEAKPFIVFPEVIPVGGFLQGKFGLAVLKEYLGRTKSDYNNAPAFNVLSYDKGVVKGSNPFAVALVGNIVGQEGFRVATPADLELAIKSNALPLRGQYGDSALVLRTEAEPNSYLARHLMQQIKARNSKAEMPAVIPLSGVELVTDQDSPHRLSFKLREDAEILHGVFVLNRDGPFSSQDIDEKTGLPKQTGNGDRTLYTRSSGLSVLYLDRNLDLDSWDAALADSDGAGRVVVVSGEATAKKISGYIQQLEQDRIKQKAEIDARFDEARKVLLGSQ